MAFSSAASDSVGSLHPSNTLEPRASDPRQDDLAVLMTTLNHRYRQYLRRQSGDEDGRPKGVSNSPDFVSGESKPNYSSTFHSKTPRHHSSSNEKAGSHGTGVNGGTPGANFVEAEEEDGETTIPHPKSLSGILFSTMTAGSASNNNNVTSNVESNVLLSHESPSSIVLPAKTGEYWGERELYMAAEDICLYLNGGVNYRQLCHQYRRLLELVLAMVREDASLAQTLLLDNNKNDASGILKSSVINGVSVVSPDLNAVENLLSDIRNLVQESKQLLKESGIELPASFANGLLNAPYNAMSAISIGSRSGSGSGSGSGPGGNANRAGLCSASISAKPRTIGGGNVGRAYAGRPNSREEGGKAVNANGKQSSSTSVAIVTGPVSDPDAEFTYVARTHSGGGGGGAPAAPRANVVGGGGGGSSASGVQRTGYTPLINVELASLLKPVSQYSQLGFSPHVHSQQRQQSPPPLNSNRGVLQRTGSDRHDIGRGGFSSSPCVAAAVLSGGNGRYTGTSTANNPARVPAGNADLTNLHGAAATSAADDSFIDPMPQEYSRTAAPGAPAMGDNNSGSHGDFLRSVSTPGNTTLPHQGTHQQPVSHLESPAVTPKAEEEAPLFAQDISAIAGVDDSDMLSGVQSPSVEGMSRDRLLRLQLAYGEGYHLSGMDFLLDAMGLIFRNEYDQGKASGDVKGSAFRTFRKDIEDRIMPALKSYEGFKTTTSEATPLRNVYLNHCFLTRTKPSDKVLDSLTGKEDRDIQALLLNGAQLGDSGVAVALCTLPRLHRLQSLDLSRNDLHDEVVPLIARAVRRRPALTHLNLSYNYLTAASLPYLLTIARTVPHLKEITLHGCTLTQEEKDLIAAEVANPTMTAAIASFATSDSRTPTFAPPFYPAVSGAALRAGNVPHTDEGKERDGEMGAWAVSAALPPTPPREWHAGVSSGAAGFGATATFPRSRYYLSLTSFQQQQQQQALHEPKPALPLGSLTVGGGGAKLPCLSSSAADGPRAVSVPACSTMPAMARRPSKPHARQQSLRGTTAPSAYTNGNSGENGARSRSGSITSIGSGHGGGVHRRVSIGSGSALPPIRHAFGAATAARNKSGGQNSK